MNCSYLSKSEIKKLEDTVKIMFDKKRNNIPFDVEYEYVKKTTELLFFLIPYRSFYIDRDLCSEFYLSMLNKTDHIINSYRIASNVPYLAYLHIILRTRTRTFVRLKNQREIKENKSITTYIKIENSMDVFEEEEEYLTESYIDEDPLEIDTDTTIENIIADISTSTPLDENNGDEEHDILVEFLKTKKNREKFLAFILNNINVLTDKEINLLSQIMNVSPNTIAKLSIKMHEINEERTIKRNNLYELKINNYWKRYIIIISELCDESLSKEKRSELETQKAYLLSSIKRCREEKFNTNRGATIKVIAEETNNSTTCIGMWIREVDELLKKIEQIMET